MNKTVRTLLSLKDGSSFGRSIPQTGNACRTFRAGNVIHRRCNSLSHVTIEAGSQTSIFGEYAFEKCLSLQSICILSSVQIPSKSCFKRCFKLSDLTFESGCRVSILGPSAFAHCSALESSPIPSSIETLSPYCFRYCILAGRRHIVRTHRQGSCMPGARGE
jgi:hypothetical protein